MHIQVSAGLPQVAPADGVEVIERKGIGHPDSLADLLAEAFSQRYALYGLEIFGEVPNHWVDKTTLVGARSRVDFGGYSIESPVQAHLFGKITRAVGDQHIPVDEIFRGAIRDLLPAATDASSIASHVESSVENTAGIAADHPATFYRPAQGGDLADTHDLRANDTVFCSAYAPATALQRLAISLENFAAGPELGADLPTGRDVKVMLVRTGTSVEITVCLPIHPEQVAYRREYAEVVSEARRRMDAHAAAHTAKLDTDWRLNVAVNTKDRQGGAYLAPWGTSLGKGDCGLVGRGNRANGIIAADRGDSGEAIAGKNPLHHAGKLYTLAAERIAHRIGMPNHTVLVARNGDRLDSPSFVGVRTREKAGSAEQRHIADVVEGEMAALSQLSKWLLTTPVLDRFRHPGLLLEA
ncbi:methionine adenosyltransferase [Streptomonospora salina]|uniref:S-adenosylmethionine synthetase n=1 Tax=Streptomonospora salina TaxID=104205 RepID=A0A841E720_9ACTN|nr:methionine adenosyltransferase [Streptomonospora salina]MBB5998806.1 S-adenosylmethionine synthetase [Streptomonospora salina]